MPNLSPDISPEVTIVVRAQQIVDRWARASAGASFASRLEQVIADPGDAFTGLDHHRQAIRQVAIAIHAGHGHAFRDRAPLLAIARSVIEEP